MDPSPIRSLTCISIHVSARVSARVSVRVSVYSICVSTHLRLYLYPHIKAQEGAETGVRIEVERLNLTTLGEG